MAIDYVRDPVPVNADARQLRGYLERTLQALDDWSAEVNTEVAVLGQIQALQGISVRYRWEDTFDTSIPPPLGYAKANNNSSPSITEVAASREDIFGRFALPNTVVPLNPGFLQVGSLTGNQSIAFFQSTGETIQHPTYVIFPVVTLDSSGPGFSQDDEMELIWWPSSLPDATSMFRGKVWGGAGSAFGNKNIVTP